MQFLDDNVSKYYKYYIYTYVIYKEIHIIDIKRTKIYFKMRK